MFGRLGQKCHHPNVIYIPNAPTNSVINNQKKEPIFKKCPHKCDVSWLKEGKMGTTCWCIIDNKWDGSVTRSNESTSHSWWNVPQFKVVHCPWKALSSKGTFNRCCLSAEKKWQTGFFRLFMSLLYHIRIQSLSLQLILIKTLFI